jgi:uncharacterized membrane protein (UPF0127 family)
MAHFLTALLARPDVPYLLRNERTGLTLATTLELAFDSQSRRRGLLGRSGLDPGVAVILAPCCAVHTLFMRFAIDVVFVRQDGVVTKVCARVKPWRATAALGAFATIELAGGAGSGTQPGDRLCLDSASLSAPHQTTIFL